MFKSNGGFTLVELIVVIAILAILAGIAVPAYSGYISKANEAADYTMLDSVKVACTFTAMEKDPEAVVEQIVINQNQDPDSVTVTVSGTDLTINSVDISDFVDVDAITFKSKTSVATWNRTAPANGKEGWILTPAN